MVGRPKFNYKTAESAAGLIKLKFEMPSLVRKVSIHSMGILAGYWCFERIYEGVWPL